MHSHRCLDAAMMKYIKYITTVVIFVCITSCDSTQFTTATHHSESLVQQPIDTENTTTIQNELNHQVIDTTESQSADNVIESTRDVPISAGQPDNNETYETPLEQLCLTHPVFNNTGLYKGVLIQPDNEFSRCEYDVTLNITKASEYRDTGGICIQVAEITASGTQLFSNGYDCYNLQPSELSIYWTMRGQYTNDPASGGYTLRDSLVFPVEAATNSLANYNIIDIPLTNESGLPNIAPPGMTTLFFHDDDTITAPYFEGELRRVTNR